MLTKKQDGRHGGDGTHLEQLLHPLFQACQGLELRGGDGSSEIAREEALTNIDDILPLRISNLFAIGLQG